MAAGDPEEPVKGLSGSVALLFQGRTASEGIRVPGQVGIHSPLRVSSEVCSAHAVRQEQCLIAHDGFLFQLRTHAGVARNGVAGEMRIGSFTHHAPAWISHRETRLVVVRGRKGR